MDFEAATDMWLKALLASLRGGAPGVFVEVGLGAGNWSFPWASRLGMRCIAIEPSPTEQLRECCGRDDVELVEAAVCRHNGTTLLYQGEMHGNKLNDISSIRSDWWGAGRSAQTVRALCLSDLAGTWNPGLFYCVKADVEGAEADVLSSLADLDPGRLPKIVAFEYGGGGSRQSGRGGWSEEFSCGTLNSLALLKDLGYHAGMVLDTTRWWPRFFTFSDLNKNADNLFSPQDEVGNIIAWRRDLLNAGGRRRGLLWHGLMQAGCALAALSKSVLGWMQHWRIRTFSWIKSRI